MHCTISNFFSIGNVLHDIRQGDSYRNRREELEDLGITFYSHKSPRGRSLSATASESVHMPIALNMIPLEREPDPLSECSSFDRLPDQHKDEGKGEGLVHLTSVLLGQELEKLNSLVGGWKGNDEGQIGMTVHSPIPNNISSIINNNPLEHIFHPHSHPHIELLHNKPGLNSEIESETRAVNGSSISANYINQIQCQLPSFQKGANCSGNISLLISGSDTCIPSQSQRQDHAYSSKKDKNEVTDGVDCIVVLV